jgi:hypothetical protein
VLQVDIGFRFASGEIVDWRRRFHEEISAGEKWHKCI